MVSIIGIIVFSAMFGTVAWTSINDSLFKRQQGNGKLKTKNIDRGAIYIWILLVLGFLARLIAATSYRGHATDMGCFMGWSDMIYTDGLSEFYQSPGFHDYPPGYVYVMYVLGAIKNLFALEDGPVLWFVLKMPAIIADLATSYLVYHFTAKTFSKKAGAVIAAFLIFNPVVILNSTVWGQVDSILGFFCVLSIYFASEKKLYASFFAFAIGLLIKPQAAFFAPVLIFAVVEHVFLEEGFSAKRLIKSILFALGAIVTMLVLFMPFGDDPIHGIELIIAQYIKTIGQYNHPTINAFNIFGMLGMNWDALTPVSSAIGYIGMIAVVVLSGFVFFKKSGKEKYYLTAFILVFGIYMLAPKMHERYAFPGIFMLIMLIAIAPKGKNFLMYGIFSLSQFFNIAWVLFIYETNPGAYFKSPAIAWGSFVNVVFFIWLIYTTTKNPNAVKKDIPKLNLQSNDFKPFRLSEKAVKITAFDISAILIITAIYGCVAFYKLGDKYAPQTETAFAQNKVTVDLGEEKHVSRTAFFLGAREIHGSRNLTFEYLDSEQNLIKPDVNESGSVFNWTIREGIATNARYVRISSNAMENPADPSDRLYLKEVCFLDNNGEIITPVNLSDNGVRHLFDEQDYLATDKSYMSGTYFDEIYHPRTAYEFLHGMSVYEWTHPPFGKVLMGIGISMFGMTPFGWRFIGTLFGVFMVAAVYLLARRTLKNKWFAVLACLIFTFDFMHFTQTRLATIDTYVTFFIMLMYYYMYKYYKQSFYDTPLYKTLIPLGISGIFFGFSVASKWTGLYAGVGLAIIFFMTLYDRYREYQYAKKSPRGSTQGIFHEDVIEAFPKNTIITLVFCCVMFIVVPFAIYAMSYGPYMNTPSGQGFDTIFINAESMLTYHGKTVVDSTHPFSSHWYEWPVIYRPLWYFSNTLADGTKQGISAMGNPAVWWVGIPAVAYCLALTIIIPLRNKNYLGKNKYNFAIGYGAIFVVLLMMAAVAGATNEKLERIVSYMFLYAVVFVATFVITLAYDYKIKQTSVRTPLFLVIGYFSSFMPWVLVVRTTYIYHYFPCVVFFILMIAYSIKTFYDNTEKKRMVAVGAIAYVAVVLGLFVLFYPVISGQPVSLEFAEKWLKWFESWVLVA